MIQTRLSCNLQYAGIAQSQLSGQPCIFDTEDAGGPYTQASIQVNRNAADPWTAAKIRLRQSNSPFGPFYDFATAVEITHVETTWFQGPQKICSRYLAAVVTTAEGTEIKVDINLYLRRGE